MIELCIMVSFAFVMILLFHGLTYLILFKKHIILTLMSPILIITWFIALGIGITLIDAYF